jgi:hypothetical protein
MEYVYTEQQNCGCDYLLFSLMDDYVYVLGGRKYIILTNLMN